jgi:hypothetical protein
MTAGAVVDKRFRQADFEARRWTPGAMMGIVLTDRCPVGCAHCSVSALMDDAGPEVNPDFAAQVRELAELPGCEVVFITGGDPFVHLDELVAAVTALTDAGKRVVVHTSGYWGDDDAVVARAATLLDRVSTLVFGVDLYHRKGVPDAALTGAMARAHAHGCWVVAQVIVGARQPDHKGYALRMLEAALGAGWPAWAEIDENPPLEQGRAARLQRFRQAPRPPGRCDVVNRRMLRFDGELTACCNEGVLQGAGPAGLRRQVGAAHGVEAALAELAGDPLVRLVHALPTGAAYELASSVAGVAPEPVAGTCDACWRTGELLAAMSEEQRARVALLADVLVSG